jgi:hypothetical protein
MKTSKIIFISLLCAIAIIILATVIELRININKNGDSEREVTNKVDKERVPPFNDLVLTNCSNVTLVQGDSTFMEMNSLKDSKAPRINYKVIGDTLKISDLKLLKGYSAVKIHFNSSLKGIHLKQSNLNIGALNLEKLAINMDQSAILFNDRNKKSIVKSLEILANNHSAVTANIIKVDSLSISLHNSAANIQSTTSEILRK